MHIRSYRRKHWSYARDAVADLNILELGGRKPLDSVEHALVVELGGRVLDRRLGPHLLSLLPVLECGEVNPLVVAGPIKVREALVGVLFVLLHLVLHVVLLDDEPALCPAESEEVPPPLHPVFALVQDVLGDVCDDALTAVLAARVTRHLKYPQVFQNLSLGVLERQTPFLVGEDVKDLEVLVPRGGVLFNPGVQNLVVLDLLVREGPGLEQPNERLFVRVSCVDGGWEDRVKQVLGLDPHSVRVRHVLAALVDGVEDQADLCAAQRGQRGAFSLRGTEQGGQARGPQRAQQGHQRVALQGRRVKLLLCKILNKTEYPHPLDEVCFHKTDF